AWPGATSVSATHPTQTDADVAALPAESLPGVGRPAPEPVTPVPWVPEIPQPAPAESRDDAQVVVEPGDCLWDIAAERLGADATVAGIAADWPRWYQANRDVVGDDPDLLLPGMVLRVPAEH
ncbi:MAG: LysM peptidoglycan-binding domain-containing protein, partial [Jiangellaceae bacterium]